MKYLLPFLETIPDGPDLANPGFQQLLVDVQAGKQVVKSADAWYESLEKIVNELKSTPESVAFQKPVSKREAPDYYDVIKKPMDLTTVLRNVKARKYKNKDDFSSDLGLIWENCFTYNTHEGHPIRAAARFMQQKANHHLDFLVDRNERGVTQAIVFPFGADSSRHLAGSSSQLATQSSATLAASQITGGDEDAAGESDDGGVIEETPSFRDEAGAGPQSQTAAQIGHSRDGANGLRDASSQTQNVNGVSGGAIAAGPFANGLSRSTPPFRVKLTTSLENAPAIIRTPHTMSLYSDYLLSEPHQIRSIPIAGPSNPEKSRSKEKDKDVSQAIVPPPWYPTGSPEDEDLRSEGLWWGLMQRDDAYVSAIPATPSMLPATPLRRKQIGKRKRRDDSPSYANGTREGEERTPPLEWPKAVNLENVMNRSVDKLFEARRIMGQIHDWQRIESEGGVLPNLKLMEAEERERAKEEKEAWREQRRTEAEEKKKRHKTGGEVGEFEAVLSMKKAAANVLALSGFEGANETALDMFTRVAIDHMRNVGRTFRLLLDGFSHQMSPQELVLHALHENGQVRTADLEAHIKDDIEREGGKIAEMTRKVKQSFKEVTTAPVIEDDMMFGGNGEMLLDGNFAEELGEDFLGLREMGIDREFGLSSLNVPSSLFYGRRRKAANADTSEVKEDLPDYPPPPPFIPLNPTTLPTQLPALLHAFFAARMESGLGLADDVTFEPARSQLGSMGQIVIKNAPSLPAKKKRPEVDPATAPVREVQVEVKKDKKQKKAVQPGVGKGNWVRPPKEERDRRAAEKRAAMERDRVMSNGINGGPGPGSGSEDAEGEDE